MDAAKQFQERQLEIWRKLHDFSPHALTHFRVPYPLPWRIDAAERARCVAIFGAISTALSVVVTRYYHDADIRSYLRLEAREHDILQMARGTPYRQGCIRPDFLYGPEGKLLISEVNGRFAFNGYMISLAFERLNQPMKQDAPSGFALFQKMLLQRLQDYPRVMVVKGEEAGGDIFGIRSFARDFMVVSPEKALRHWRQDDFVILELKQREIDALTDDFLGRLIAHGSYLNDVRTIFLGHDKRFLALVYAGILDAHLPLHVAQLLRECLIPSYVPSLAPSDIFQSALTEQDEWLLKPIRSGKGQGILLGICTGRGHWQTALQSDSYVLQKFVRQPTFELQVLDAEKRLSRSPMHVVGLIAGMDGICFGPGIYRASTEDIVNVFSGGHILGQQLS